MKKLLLIALAVLSVCMLVACNASGISEKEAEERTQAKLDEAADTFGEYLRFSDLLQRYLWDDVRSQIGAYSGSTKNNETITKLSGTDVASIVEYLYTTDENRIDANSTYSSFVEGTLSGTYYDVTISNVKLNATYDVYSRTQRDEDGQAIKTKEVKDEELIISKGSFKQTTNEDENVSTTSIKTTINDVEYSLEYTFTEGKYTYASVNGKQVSAKFLNVLNTYGNGEWY